MDNEILNKALIKKDRFERLGSLKDFCDKFGGIFDLSVYTTKVSNLMVIIKTVQQVEFKLFCSIPLSKIIKDNDFITKEFIAYEVLRITKNDGTKYIRISQSINIEGDSNMSFEENFKLSGNIKGNKKLVFKSEGIKSETAKQKPNSPEDLIAF